MGYVIAGIGIIVGVICVIIGLEIIGILDFLLTLIFSGAVALAEKK